MPIPTPDFQSQENQNQPNSDGAICSTGQADISSFTALDGSVPRIDAGGRDNNASQSQDDRADRPLSKEEADRLYEERMEDEYAKREGGA
jgi:sucrose-6-phosphate hydrolase SacC (GH32 family)